jgi:polyhydroxyalkanoate synthesis regulator phasin
MLKRSLLSLSVSLALALAAVPMNARAADEAKSLEELRNTVINLLEGLVKKGVLTQEQAQSMVADAQAKAEAQAKAKSAQEEAEKGAVRVTHVPEIVRKQIEDEVRGQLRDDVTKEVIAKAKEEQWGVPGALPDWIKNVKLYGDVRFRAEGDLYASDNAQNVYINFNNVNSKGGIGKAGTSALLNVSEDRYRSVGRLRLGLMADLGNAFKLDARITSGNPTVIQSTNQTLGNYDGRWATNIDKAALIWNPVFSNKRQEFDFRFGRFDNPFATNNELVWDVDVTFEGLSATYAWDVFNRDRNKMERGLFLTAGAFPLQEVELSTKDKWILGGQLGTNIPLGAESNIRLSASYYDFTHVTGVQNPPGDSTLTDFTAPAFLQKGNTLYDIRNDTDSSTNLFALAGKYRLVSANLLVDVAAFGSTHVMIGGEYVKNIGWKTSEVRALTGQTVEARTKGYEGSISVGKPAIKSLLDWRAFMLYRYVQRDAVMDVFTDSDFHLGGTDAKGYQLGFDLGLSRGAWMRLRYLSANEIDGPPLGIDVWMLDLNGSF